MFDYYFSNNFGILKVLRFHSFVPELFIVQSKVFQFKIEKAWKKYKLFNHLLFVHKLPGENDVDDEKDNHHSLITLWLDPIRNTENDKFGSNFQLR